MKLALLFISLLVFASLHVVGCIGEPPTTHEYMIIAPKTVTFMPGDSASNVSITHSCTCAFNWHSTVIPSSASAWLSFPPDTTGDHKSIPIAVRPSMYASDTNEAWIAIRSNEYGVDTIHVFGIRK
jgi:hypothetical protein